MAGRGKSHAIEESILEVCRKHGKAVPDSVLAVELPHTTAEQRVVALNSLLIAHRVQIFQPDDDAVPTYRAVLQEETVKLRGLTAEDALVYQVITQAGNTGIWTRDMKQRTNLPQAKIAKTLKVLEERGLVKHVKSVQNVRQKVYMLSTLEPGREITGGPWYGQEGQPDQEFIEQIRDVARRFVEARKEVTLQQVVDFIAGSGVTTQYLGAEDVHSVMKTLEYDYLVEELEITDGNQRMQLYKPAPAKLAPHAPLTDMPCGVCPVFEDCHEGGRVSPQTCQYFTQWLQALDF